jgi:type IV secretory pathway VirB3-like protein
MSEYPSDYAAPVCEPLTRRIMNAGVPQDALMWLFIGGYMAMVLKIYVLLPVVAVAYLLLRALYARDEWAVALWLEHARAVWHGRVDLSV